MKRFRATFMVLSMVIGALVLIAGLSAATAAPPFLPGVTVKDDHPKGCVDCHQNLGAGKDYRITTGLAAMKTVKHPDISKIVKTVPNDCAMCHKEGTKTPALNIVLHKSHYADPAKNTFVTVYQGACLNCHSLNAATGVMGMKSAPANW